MGVESEFLQESACMNINLHGFEHSPPRNIISLEILPIESKKNRIFAELWEELLLLIMAKNEREWLFPTL